MENSDRGSFRSGFSKNEIIEKYQLLDLAGTYQRLKLNKMKLKVSILYHLQKIAKVYEC